MRFREFSGGDLVMGDILTAKELASYLKLRESTVRNFAKRGDLPAIKIGRHWRFKMDKILMLFPEKKVVEQVGPN
jgi:PTS system nitrogen regulatory IIA component